MFKIRIKKSKTYKDWCPFQGLSYGITLMQADLIWQDGTFNTFFNSFQKDECAFILRVNRRNVPVIPHTQIQFWKNDLNTRCPGGRGILWLNGKEWK